MPILTQPLELGEQLWNLLGGEHGGRLIEDQHRDVAVEQLEDFDLLAGGDGDVADQRIRVQIELEFFNFCPDQLAGAFLVDPPETVGRLHTEDDVLPDGVLGDQDDLLVDHADPGGDGFARFSEVDLPAAVEDAPLIEWHQAVEHFH